MRGVSLIAAVAALAACISCRPAPPRPTPPASAGATFPRCVAFDDNGNAVTCSAPSRTYDGDGCACANGYGKAYYGRVQEYAR